MTKHSLPSESDRQAGRIDTAVMARTHIVQIGVSRVCRPFSRWYAAVWRISP